MEKTSNQSYRSANPNQYNSSKNQIAMLDGEVILPEIIKETPTKSVKSRSKDRFSKNHGPSKFKYAYKLQSKF